MGAGSPPHTTGQRNRALHQGAELTYDEALRVRKLFEEFPEIFIPLFVGRTQHLQITERLLKRGAGMSTEKRSGKQEHLGKEKGDQVHLQSMRLGAPITADTDGRIWDLVH